jgi:uncharacterized RDD family membrane protein YckC
MNRFHPTTQPALRSPQFSLTGLYVMVGAGLIAGLVVSVMALWAFVVDFP